MPTASHMRLIAVNLSDELRPEYVHKYIPDSVEMLTHPVAVDVLSNHLGVTPQTLLLAASGAIQRVWTGQVSDIREIERAIELDCK